MDVVALPLAPFLYPERLLHVQPRTGMGRYAPVAKVLRIPREHWPEIADRARCEGLRPVARELGFSYETVRAIVRQVEHAIPALSPTSRCHRDTVCGSRRRLGLR